MATVARRKIVRKIKIMIILFDSLQEDYPMRQEASSSE